MSEQPYKPSWVDRLTASIDRLSAPPWLVYLIVTVLWGAIFIAVQTWQGAYQEDGFFGWHIFVVVQSLYGVMAVHYMDRVAANALHRFRPVMKENELEFDAALYRLTTLPARQTLIASLLGGLFAVFQLLVVGDAEAVASWQLVAPTPISLAVHHINIVVAWIGYGVFVYHAYHQLKVINWLYTSKAIIDPFYPKPLHALSEITARTALVFLLVGFGWYLEADGAQIAPLSESAFILISSSMLAFDLVVFIWPLWGAHRLLVDAKNSALENNAIHYKITVMELHHSVSVKALDQIEVWRDALDALDIERRRLDRLATWPWSPGAFRNLLVTMIIPIIVWIVQFGLQRVLE